MFHLIALTRFTPLPRAAHDKTASSGMVARKRISSKFIKAQSMLVLFRQRRAPNAWRH